VLGVVLPFLGPFLSARGLGAVAVGLATAGFSVAKLVYTPFLGFWVDRGRWFTGLLSVHVGLAVLASLPLLWARNPWFLGLALLSVGIGYGSVLPLIEAAVLERPPKQGYGFVRWWGSAGFIAAAGMTSAVVGAGRLGAFPIVLTALLVLLGAVCVPLERESRPGHATDRGVWVSGATVWLLLAILTLNQIAHGPYYAFFSIHLGEHGFGTGVVAGLWSVSVLAEAVTFVAGRRLERRLGLRRLLGLALALAPIRWLLLALPPTLPVLLAAQLGHAATFAAAHLAGVQLVQRVVPPGARRNAQALYSGLSFGLGIVLGTAVAGPLYAAFSGSGSFLAATGLSVVVAVGWFTIARRFPV